MSNKKISSNKLTTQTNRAVVPVSEDCEEISSQSSDLGATVTTSASMVDVSLIMSETSNSAVLPSEPYHESEHFASASAASLSPTGPLKRPLFEFFDRMSEARANKDGDFSRSPAIDLTGEEIQVFTKKFESPTLHELYPSGVIVMVCCSNARDSVSYLIIHGAYISPKLGKMVPFKFYLMEHPWNRYIGRIFSNSESREDILFGGCLLFSSAFMGSRNVQVQGETTSESISVVNKKFAKIFARIMGSDIIKCVVSPEELQFIDDVATDWGGNSAAINHAFDLEYCLKILKSEVVHTPANPGFVNKKKFFSPTFQSPNRK